MGVTLTDVLLFGKAQSDDVDNATLVIYRRNILRWSALGGYLDIIVKGVSPLSLPDAIANSLEYLKAFGGTEQNGTPTPDAPVDIVCNNGVLKFGQYGKNLLNDTKFKTGYLNATAPEPEKSDYVSSSTTASTNWTTMPVKVTAGQSYTIKFFTEETFTAIGYAVYQNGEQVQRVANTPLSNNEKTITPNESGNLYVWCAGAGNISVTSLIGKVQIEVGSTATDYEPYHFGIHADGTVETINVRGKNLFDGAIELGSIDPATGSLVPNSSRTRSANFIPVQPNTTYTFTRGDSGGIRWIVGYDKDKNGITDGTPNQPAAITNLNSSSVMSKTFTTTPTTHYIKWYNTSNAGLNEKVQIEVGSTATDYEPYYNGGTATAEMLLSLDDYTDVQELISGDVTRNVGIIVFDGTEIWTSGSLGDGIRRIYSSTALPDAPRGDVGLCTHFVRSSFAGRAQSTNPNTFQAGNTSGSRPYIGFKVYDSDFADATAWVKFLSDQYAAGTPVIVVYALGESATESVAGQALQVQAGDNTIEITQASLDGLELEVKYQAAVSLTIQEVQDANLDPNVQVTIN